MKYYELQRTKKSLEEERDECIRKRDALTCEIARLGLLIAMCQSEMITETLNSASVPTTYNLREV